MNDFWAGVLSGISVPAILAVIGLMFKDHILMRLSEAVKKKNQLEIENAKGEVLKTVEANKAQHLKDIESVKLTLNKDLEKFKQEFERTKITNEHNHQISQEAYKSFFNAKMKAYIELANLKQKYLKKITEYIYRPDLDEIDSVASTEVNKMQNFIQANKIYLSDKLVELFDEWDEIVTKERVRDDFIIEVEWQRIEQEAQTEEMSANAYANMEKYYNNLRTLHKNSDKWKEIIQQIDIDIKSLKKKYDI